MSPTSALPAPRVSSWRRSALVGYVVIATTFGGLGTWAAIAPLDRAVVAAGMVVIEDNRKVIQHLEGGIVSEVPVREGQTVKAGDVLLKLSTVQAQSTVDLLRGQIDGAGALEARLVAELDGSNAITMPAELELRRDEPAVSRLMRDQQIQFRERKASLSGQADLINAKITQLDTESAGVRVEKQSTENQLVYVNDELVGMRALRDKGLIQVGRVLQLERERARLEGIVGRATADIAKAANGQNEARLQLSQIRQKFQEEVSAQLLEVRQKLGELRDRIAIGRDILTRTTITAPRSGTIQAVKVFSVGQVVRPAESLMEIVPDSPNLLVQVQLPVNEIEHLRVGQTAEIRFGGFHGRNLPRAEGVLRSLSRDRMTDETSRQPYFLGLIALDRNALAEPYRSNLVAGMPADAMIATGERTALNYLISPLEDSLRRSFRN